MINDKIVEFDMESPFGQFLQTQGHKPANGKVSATFGQYPELKAEEFKFELEQIRKAFCISRWYITYKSSVDHFDFDKEDLIRISKELGVEVENKDLLIDLAEKIRN